VYAGNRARCGGAGVEVDARAHDARRDRRVGLMRGSRNGAVRIR
jgi:hypothetical protein